MTFHGIGHDEVDQIAAAESWLNHGALAVHTVQTMGLHGG